MKKTTKTSVKEVIYFAELAQNYCDIIEEQATIPADEFIVECAGLIANLFAAALRFRNLEESTSPDYDCNDVSTSSDRIAELTTQIGEKLGSYNRYWEVVQPYELAEPVSITLGEDLADIYCDLKNGLIFFHGGQTTDVMQAAFHWELLFFHWGEHAVDALRAIKRIPYTDI